MLLSSSDEPWHQHRHGSADLQGTCSSMIGLAPAAHLGGAEAAHGRAARLVGPADLAHKPHVGHCQAVVGVQQPLRIGERASLGGAVHPCQDKRCVGQRRCTSREVLLHVCPVMLASCGHSWDLYESHVSSERHRRLALTRIRPDTSMDQPPLPKYRTSTASILPSYLKATCRAVAEGVWCLGSRCDGAVVSGYGK